MAGRRAIGSIQAGIMVAGFVFTMGYLLVYLGAVLRYLQNPSWTEGEFHASYQRYQWALAAGLPLCAVAWCWSLASSVSILRRAAGTRPGDEPASTGARPH